MTVALIVLWCIVLFHATMNALLDPDTHPVRRRIVSQWQEAEDRFVWPWQLRWWRAWLDDWQGRYWRALMLTGYFVVREGDYYRFGSWRRQRRPWGVQPAEDMSRFWVASTSSRKRALTFWWRGYP